LTELATTLTTLAEAQTGLQLSPTDLCFIVALRARADQGGLTAFEEESLVDVFAQVIALVEPGAEALRLRATSAIRRLREQRLLTRIDGAGIVRAGEYALTRLADALAEFFLAEETLTRESLVILSQTLVAQLLEIKAQALTAPPENWRPKVIQPLRITAGDLLAGIERRQRGLDLSQEHIRENIADLLRNDWFSAIEACENLLEETATTLRELNDILLRDTATLQTLLQDIGEIARESDSAEGQRAAQQLGEQVDRVAAWGSSRQRAWSDYYRYVQRFLRDVVRLDPGRALSQRLRDQLRHHCDRPFHLTCAEVVPFPLLRVPDLRSERPIVSRPAQSPEELAPPIEDVPPEVVPYPLDARTRELLSKRPETLASVVRVIVGELPPDEHFRQIGRIVAICGTETQLSRSHIRPWQAVGGGLEIEDWTFAWRKRR
jgi:chromosome partition protein MukF